jgi:hypothetical protein
LGTFRISFSVFALSVTFQELGIINNSTYPPSIEQQLELIKSIAKNQDLYRLELGCLTVLHTYWENLIVVIGSHKSLRSLVFWIQSEPDLLQVRSLVPLLKENCHLDISFKSRSREEALLDKVQAIVEPVRLQNRAKALARHPVHSGMHKAERLET